MFTVKYPIKIAGTLFRKGTTVTLATLEDVRKIWPAIAPEAESKQVAVWFPGINNPTIVERSQLEES